MNVIIMAVLPSVDLLAIEVEVEVEVDSQQFGHILDCIRWRSSGRFRRVFLCNTIVYAIHTIYTIYKIVTPVLLDGFGNEVEVESNGADFVVLAEVYFGSGRRGSLVG